jgi:rod shape determining protein RodA
MLPFGYRWKDFDIYMLVTTFVLMGFGVVAIWSATGEDVLTLGNLGVRQAFFGIAGLGVMVLFANLDYRFFSSFAWIIYGLGIAALGIVLVIGVVIAGSQRWIYVGQISFQPSEFAKLATIIALAAFISSRGDAMKEMGNFFVSLLIVALPMALVFLEPDLGSAIVYAVIWASMMTVTRTRWLYFAGMALMAVPASLLAWQFVLHDYMRNRLLISYNPESDPTGAGFNIIQARISIGSGGLFGRGYLEGTQSQLGFLRITQSDFIFSAAAEELGFIGASVLFCLFVLLLFRLTRAADLSRDDFGRLLTFGVAAMILFAAVANLGANLTLLPVTGIPLPFISYGRTSLLTNLAALGIVQSVLLYRLKYRY